MVKKYLALFIALVLVVAALPITAAAAGDSEETDPVIVVTDQTEDPDQGEPDEGEPLRAIPMKVNPPRASLPRVIPMKANPTRASPMTRIPASFPILPSIS